MVKTFLMSLGLHKGGPGVKISEPESVLFKISIFTRIYFCFYESSPYLLSKCLHTIKMGYICKCKPSFGLFATHFFINSTTGTIDTHRVPAIYKILRDRKDRKVFEIKAHPMVSKLFEMKLYNSIKFSVTDVPMLVPPLPWNSTQVYLSFLFLTAYTGAVLVWAFFSFPQFRQFLIWNKNILIPQFSYFR